MPTKKSIIAKKDREWKEVIRERDKCCQICKRSEGKLDAHHLIPKQFKEFRWDVDNGMILCFQHHKVGKYSAHLNAIWFAQWLLNNQREIYYDIIKKLEQIAQ